MSWNEQAESLVKALTEAQNQVWESWCGLIRNAPVSPMIHPGLFDQWQELAAQGLKAWTGETDHVVKDVGKRLLETQDVTMRFLHLSLTMWKSLAPKLESGEDWRAALNTSLEQMRQQLLHGPQMTAALCQDMGELWRLYLEQWQKLGLPWAESLHRTTAHFGQASMGDGSALLELANFYWDAHERTFGRLLESPSLGHTREMHEVLLKGFAAWIDNRRASFEYYAVLSQAWTKAFERFMEKLVSLAQPGDTTQNLRQFLYLWTEVVDEVFAELSQTEEYVHAQARLVNTAMAYRVRELDVVEAFLKTGHVPTRKELDEAYRRIYELRKEVKELKAMLQDTGAVSPERTNMHPPAADTRQGAPAQGSDASTGTQQKQ